MAGKDLRDRVAEEPSSNLSTATAPHLLEANHRVHPRGEARFSERTADRQQLMRGARLSYAGAFLAALAVGALAINGQSLWIDEGTTAIKAIQPTLWGLWDSLRADGSSNLQLPLHYLYIWVWEKCLGGSEISLRAANILPLAVAFIAVVWG